MLSGLLSAAFKTARPTTMKALLLTFATACALLFAQSAAKKPAAVPTYGYKVVHVYPHDRGAFTEGLEYHDGFLYESTGLNGRSSLRKVKLETGQIVRSIALPRQYFGEGIAILGDRIAQLTYRTQIGFVYSLKDFTQLSTFTYKGEGWSFTHNANTLFMDDGTSEIRLWNPKTFAERGRIKVHEGSRAIDNVNELEYVEGELYANIWQTDRIARISPTTGAILGWIDLSGLLSPMHRNGTEDVLNGIAYDAAHKRLFVTGKFWPSLFEIEVVPKK
jgi:glutamine cyclotransferase